jgi:hypothetical protein
MESVNLIFDDRVFDKLLAESLPETRDPTSIVFKDHVTENKMPGAIISFIAVTPDGQHHRVQTVVTARLLHDVFLGMWGRYKDKLGGFPPPKIMGEG